MVSDKRSRSLHTKDRAHHHRVTATEVGIRSLIHSAARPEIEVSLRSHHEQKRDIVAVELTSAARVRGVNRQEFCCWR